MITVVFNMASLTDSSIITYKVSRGLIMQFSTENEKQKTSRNQIKTW